MKQSILADLICPSGGEATACHSQLAFDESFPAVRATYDEHDIIEGLMRCRSCEAEYPILCGLALVLPDTGTYLRTNYDAILSLAAAEGAPVSRPMLDYLQRRGAHIAPRESAGGWNYSAARTLSVYLSAHYDNLLDTLSPSHPLGRLLREYYRRDLYAVLMGMLMPHLDPTQRALDVGCNVGRLSRELAMHCGTVYGVDLAFGGAYTARRALLGRPAPLTGYELFRDGHIRQPRLLDLPPLENAEVLIASGANLPFPDAIFDVVNSANIIDVVTDPAQLVQEKLRVLKTSGLFAITDPYSWEIAAPIEKWLGGRGTLPSTQALRQRLNPALEVLAEADDVPWVLRDYDRKFSIYLNHCLVGRKHESAREGTDGA